MLSEKSYYVLEVLERISLEYLLHIHTILDPILSIEEMGDFPYKTLDETEMTKLCLDKVFGRLCAYCAWGLWNDKELYEAILEPQNLDGIWNQNPVNEIVSDPQRNDFHENNFGKLYPESKGDIEVQRQKLEKYLNDQLKRVRKWQENPKINLWNEAIKNYLAKNSQKKGITFFELVDENEATIRKRLKKMHTGFAYLTYKKSSMLIHGSTLDQFFNLSENIVKPSIEHSSSDIESKADIVGSTCNGILLLLTELKDELW